jgi:glycosyltransferase involved in cell wall biosynthesis
MLICLFWLSAVFALFSYFLYPAMLKLLSLKKTNRLSLEPNAALPSISLIVTAYNEEKRIEKKIANSLALIYEGPLLEIIVASDCSDDKTDELVNNHADRGVKLVRAQERLGKENAQLAAISVAKGEILVFSDVATEIPPDALQNLAAYFSDPKIGAISSEDRFVSQDGTVAGEGAYVKYEMWLRGIESSLAGLVGLSGSFFAARKLVCSTWDIHSPSDFNTALNTAKAGLRAISAPDVLGYYQDLSDPSKEYARKVRTVIRGMTGLWRHKEVLNFSKTGLFAFQIFGHKLMRWLTPWFLLSTFILNALIATHGFIYSLVFIVQLGFYGMAIAAHFLPSCRSIILIKIIYFFVQVNIALLDAGIKFTAGQRMTTWKPSAR